MKVLLIDLLYDRYSFCTQTIPPQLLIKDCCNIHFDGPGVHYTVKINYKLPTKTSILEHILGHM